MRTNEAMAEGGLRLLLPSQVEGKSLSRNITDGCIMGDASIWGEIRVGMRQRCVTDLGQVSIEARLQGNHNTYYCRTARESRYLEARGSGSCEYQET